MGTLQKSGGLLSRAWNWIRERQVVRSCSRRLHVAATASLGEKRFVAVVQMDGLEFLVGGGASNVVLLAELNGKEQFKNVLEDRISNHEEATPAQAERQAATAPMRPKVQSFINATAKKLVRPAIEHFVRPAATKPVPPLPVASVQAAAAIAEPPVRRRKRSAPAKPVAKSPDKPKAPVKATAKPTPRSATKPVSKPAPKAAATQKTKKPAERPAAKTAQTKTARKTTRTATKRTGK